MTVIGQRAAVSSASMAISIGELPRFSTTTLKSARRRPRRRSGPTWRTVSWKGSMVSVAGACATSWPSARECATTVTGQARASASEAFGGCRWTCTSCSYSPAVPHGFRKTVVGETVHQVSGRPSTRTSNASTISPWLRTVASSATVAPGATETAIAAPASSRPAGSRSVSSVESRASGGAGGRYAAGSEASVAVGRVVSSHARYSPQAQKSWLTATVPHPGHSSSLPISGVISASRMAFPVSAHGRAP